MADPLVPVGFRSRQPAETMPEPEISLGTEVESITPSDRPTGAAQQTAAQPATDTTLRSAALPPGPRAGVMDEPPSRLPSSDGGQRAAELEMVGRQADALVRRGYRLAERGAVYSARQHFLEALALTARSLDLAEGTQIHRRSLAEGNTALVESRQLVAPAGVSLDLARIVAVHRTVVLKSVPLDQLSSIVAQQRYLTFAQERLAVAAGGQPAASLALYALGKSAPQMQPAGSLGALAAMGEQVACYQAALACDPRNHLAANELGVILAESGRLDAARDLFSRSLAISEHAATWQNLALTLARLGDTAAASRAAVRADALRAQRSEPVTGDNVRWVDPATFARNPAAGDGQFPPAVADKPSGAPPSPAPPPKKRVAFFPWSNKTQR